MHLQTAVLYGSLSIKTNDLHVYLLTFDPGMDQCLLLGKHLTLNANDNNFDCDE